MSKLDQEIISLFNDKKFLECKDTIIERIKLDGDKNSPEVYYQCLGVVSFIIRGRHNYISPQVQTLEELFHTY